MDHLGQVGGRGRWQRDTLMYKVRLRHPLSPVCLSNTVNGARCTAAMSESSPGLSTGAHSGVMLESSFGTQGYPTGAEGPRSFLSLSATQGGQYPILTAMHSIPGGDIVAHSQTGGMQVMHFQPTESGHNADRRFTPAWSEHTQDGSTYSNASFSWTLGT